MSDTAMPAAAGSLPLRRWLAPACVMLCCAGLAWALAMVWGGSAATWAALKAIGAGTFVIGTAVCAVSLLLRFARWQFILSMLGHRLPLGFNLRVYLAGIALSSTPGKLGETLRSVLLLPRGVPVSRSLGAFLADRLSDAIAVAALGAVAAAVSGQRQPLLEAIAAVVLLGAAVIAHLLRRNPLQAPPSAAAAQPRWRVWFARAQAPLRAWAAVWRGPRPLYFIAAAAVVYGVQALVFTAYVQQAAPAIDAASGVAIFCSATLIGAASLLPGGLGAMDSALVLQLLSRGVPLPDAMAATLAVRASTLWFAWLVGFVSLASFGNLRPGRDA